MLIMRALAGSSLIALMAGTAFAQVTIVGANRSEVQDNGRDNKTLVEQATQDSDRNSSLIVFDGSGNRATVGQVGFDNGSTSRHQGSNNTSAVRQLGFRNSATLLQVGNGNGSSIDQYLDPGVGRYPDRVAVVEQRGNANSSSVVQVNGSNTATVRQGTATEASNGGVSTIYQFSSGNTATVTMVGGSPDAANRSHVEQTRIDPVFTNNDATVNISGSFNLSYLYQVGARNIASHTATGTQNTIVGKSYGNSLTSSVSQAGYRNFVTVNQFAGDRNFSKVEQRDDGANFGPGGDRQVYVSQGGSDNSSTVIQRFSQNAVVVNQQGAGTVTDIFQNGAGNFARANLLNGSLDALNKSTILQEWDQNNVDTRHIADQTIRGLGNESSISQRGVRHVASVDMAGGGVGMDDATRRRGNSVAVVQDPRLANSPSGPALYGAGHAARVQVGLLQGGGVGTVTSITQSGQHSNIGNDAVVRQDGQYDRVTVSQSIGFVEAEGGAVANVATRGLLNQVTINQFGRQFAFVTQGFGRESSFTSTSYGSGGRRNGFLMGPGIGNNSINASQYGDRNTASVGQEGSFNGTTIWQTIGSSDNSISVIQGIRTFQAPEGFGQACSFGCEMAGNSTAAATQSGRFNSASITQYSGASHATINQIGTGSSGLRNAAGIVQFRTTSAEASILQAAGVGPSAAGDPASGAVGDPSYFAGGARAAEARIRQTGLAVSGRIEQRGRGQYAFIDQSGVNNFASILQDVDATNATAIITQSGSGNSYNVVQTQPGQYINVSQTGTNNSATNVVARP
jgi:hypothetical protein